MENKDITRKNNLSILFVCTGNTCRSCMAEGIFRYASYVEVCKSGFSAVSRGIHAFDGDSASEHSINALKALWDIDISLHKAKRLDYEDVLKADFTFTMTRAHRDILKARFPDKYYCIYTLKEYAYPEIEQGSNMLDISDPYGMPYHRYESCAKEIFECIKIVIEKFK
ncbi:protein-tyrosine phosphatase [Ruminiclostridium sufflavum DSM 19573]|uniref:Protein-tyrosine phosphatase n=1 Tax=Ruminiclostridium sufflavum DSM 19573 TaxID=1121337 RepID=A0A318XNG1_9FIRM|nr:low molecular weight protein arginine phosphatase [Ruminiclostridium sufflavum]PYG89542.1 protein-tyrosine phosphatase [Ruminiclostridium sufflavum DSM 19573]